MNLASFVPDVANGELISATDAIDMSNLNELGTPPFNDLTNDSLTSIDDIYIFSEAQQLSLQNSLAVDWLAGTDATNVTYGGGTQPTGGLITEGTFVTSHILHMDTENMQQSTLMGSATFDSEILGVIIDTNSLNASDSTFGVDGVAYPTASGRAWEIGGKTGNFTISNDGMTITVVGLVEELLDQMRVITAASAGFVEFTTNQTIDVDNFDFECFDVIVSGGTLTINGVHMFNSLTILGGSVTHDVEIGMDLTFSHDVIVSAGTFISADARGLGTDAGPGAGMVGNEGSGAGYGGAGANASTAGGGTYGSLTQPTDLGSGGGTSILQQTGGTRGGGAIRLTVGGTLVVDGQITADGSSSNSDRGCGSGGSVWIETGNLEGFGFIDANGGVGGDGSAGGGSEF